MKRIHYGWFVCIVCTGVMFCALGLTSTAFSVYFPWLIKEGNLSNTQVGMIPTIRPIASTVIVFFSDRIYKKIGMRYSLVLSCIMLTIAFILFGLGSYPFYLLAAVFAGCSYALGGMLTISLLIRSWFESDRGMALGFCSAGSGLASFIVPPVVTLVIERYSLKTALLLPAVFAAVMAVLAFLIVRDTPEIKNAQPYQKKTVTDKKKEVHTDEGSDDPVVWGVSIVAVFLMAVVGYGMIQNQALLYTTSGQPPMTVSMLISLCGITVMIIKPIYGKVTDQLGAYISNYIFFGILIIGGILSTMAQSKNLAVAVCAVICLGISLPIASVGPSLYANDIGGKEKHSRILKIYQLAIPLGQILVGPLPGILADKTGNYVTGYVFMTAVAVLAVLFIQFAYKRLDGLNFAKVSNARI